MKTFPEFKTLLTEQRAQYDPPLTDLEVKELSYVLSDDSIQTEGDVRNVLSAFRQRHDSKRAALLGRKDICLPVARKRS